MGFEKLQQLARSKTQIMVRFEDSFPRESINIDDPKFIDKIDEMLDHLVTVFEKLSDEEFQDWDFYQQSGLTKKVEVWGRPEHIDCGRRVYYRKNYEAITAPMTVNFDECHVLVNFFEGIV